MQDMIITLVLFLVAFVKTAAADGCPYDYRGVYDIGRFYDDMALYDKQYLTVYSVSGPQLDVIYSADPTNTDFTFLYTLSIKSQLDPYYVISTSAVYPLLDFQAGYAVIMSGSNFPLITLKSNGTYINVVGYTTSANTSSAVALDGYGANNLAMASGGTVSIWNRVEAGNPNAISSTMWTRVKTISYPADSTPSLSIYGNWLGVVSYVSGNDVWKMDLYLFSAGSWTLVQTFNPAVSGGNYFTSFDVGPYAIFITDGAYGVSNIYKLNTATNRWALLTQPGPVGYVTQDAPMGAIAQISDASVYTYIYNNGTGQYVQTSTLVDELGVSDFGLYVDFGPISNCIAVAGDGIFTSQFWCTTLKDACGVCGGNGCSCGQCVTTGQVTTGQLTTGPVTTGHATTGQATTGPVTTAPVTTGQATTGPVTTGQATTAPATTAPVTTGQATTAPATTAPVTTGQATTGPVTTGQATTAPVTTGQATTGQVTTGQATTGPVTTGQATTAPVTTGQATTGQATTGQATTAPVTTGQATTGQATTGQVTTGPVTTGQATTAPVTTGQATTAPVTTGQATTGQATTGQATTGSVTTGHATTGQATTSPVTTGPVTTGQTTTGPATTGQVTTGEATTGQATTGEGTTGSLTTGESTTGQQTTSMTTTTSESTTGQQTTGETTTVTSGSSTSKEPQMVTWAFMSVITLLVLAVLPVVTVTASTSSDLVLVEEDVSLIAAAVYTRRGSRIKNDS